MTLTTLEWAIRKLKMNLSTLAGGPLHIQTGFGTEIYISCKLFRPKQQLSQSAWQMFLVKDLPLHVPLQCGMNQIQACMIQKMIIACSLYAIAEGSRILDGVQLTRLLVGLWTFSKFRALFCSKFLSFFLIMLK